MFGNIAADIRRKQNNYLLVNSFFNKNLKSLLQLGTLAVIFHRFGHWSHGRPLSLRFPFKALYYALRPFVVCASGIDINPRVEIGPGLIVHNFSSVFVDASEIGASLTLNQCTTIGPDWSGKGRPKLGAGVFLGSGAKVLGDVEIGSNVVVAANALVVRSVADNCLVAGVPGMVIQKDLPDDYVQSTRPHGPG